MTVLGIYRWNLSKAGNLLSILRAGFVETIGEFAGDIRAERALSTLSDRHLQDIAIHRGDIESARSTPHSESTLRKLAATRKSRSGNW